MNTLLVEHGCDLKVKCSACSCEAASNNILQSRPCRVTHICTVPRLFRAISNGIGWAQAADAFAPAGLACLGLCGIWTSPPAWARFVSWISDLSLKHAIVYASYPTRAALSERCVLGPVLPVVRGLLPAGIAQCYLVKSCQVLVGLPWPNTTNVARVCARGTHAVLHL